MINTPKYHKHYILSGNFFSPFYFTFNFLSSRYSFSKCGDKFIPYLVLPLIKRDFAFWGFWLLIVYVGFLCCVTLRNFSIASNIISFFSAGETRYGANQPKTTYKECVPENQDHWHEIKNGRLHQIDY